MDLVAQFDSRLEKLKDADYEKLEVPPCEVKAIQNSQGVSDFWIKCLLNHNIGETIKEKDRPILGYLLNIEMDLHKEDRGFDLIFTFGSNNYFNETVIKKSLYMKTAGVLDSTESTSITWKEGCNPTLKKQKKKKKGKKVTVETECESFFNLFKKMSQEEQDKIDANRTEEPAEDEIPENDLDWNLELSEMIKDDVIPLALEYYLGVIEVEQPDYEDGDSDDSEGGAAKPKGKKGGKQPKLPPGAKPEDCKQQ